MELIRVDETNIDQNHICCAIADEGDCQVASKKGWLRERFADGLVFLRGDVRGKCFIEYIPAEKAFAPVDADGYMYIDCLWVAGQFKGQGNAAKLMDYCINDSKSKGKAGLVCLSSAKKHPFLSDKAFMTHYGFAVADKAEPDYELLYLPLDDNAKMPRFTPSVKESRAGEGFVLYYTRQCPYTAKYVPVAAEIAEKHGVKLKTVLLETSQQAKSSPAVFTTYSLFKDGNLIAREILSEKKLDSVFGQ